MSLKKCPSDSRSNILLTETIELSSKDEAEEHFQSLRKTLISKCDDRCTPDKGVLVAYWKGGCLAMLCPYPILNRYDKTDEPTFVALYWDGQGPTQSWVLGC